MSWLASYRKGKDKHVKIDGTQIDECPVSYITAKSAALVALYSRAAVLSETLGQGTAYGADISQWPAVLVDAVVTCRSEENHAQNLIMES